MNTPQQTERIESLSKKIHELYQQEAKRQGDVRHHDDYDAVEERFKEFDRVIARFVISEVEAAEERVAKDIIKDLEDLHIKVVASHKKATQFSINLAKLFRAKYLKSDQTN